ncbi:MAG: arylesterase [Xanthomonadales bacterium]|nr:arylesterase [Xanthomonadales bacterium]MCP5477067.1 arylesterase [Rhodanobacteraceae bacterium]
MRRILFLLLLWWGTALAAAEVRTLLVMGDSLSAAHNIPTDQGWVQLLQNKLAESHPGQWQVVNASISGETTAGGLTRLPAALKTHRPSLVLIELGANDGLRGLQIASMRANLLQMIELARGADAKVGLIGIELPANYGEAYRSRFRAVYQQLASELQLPLLPFLLDGLAMDLANFQEDQVHPTAAAQAHIRDTVWNWLEPQLK